MYMCMAVSVTGIAELPHCVTVRMALADDNWNFMAWRPLMLLAPIKCY